VPVATDKIFAMLERMDRAKAVDLSDATFAIDVEATRLCAGLCEEQLRWRPRPARWSIAENLSHLRITTEVFLPVVDSTLAATRKRKLHSEGPFNLGLYGAILVWQMDSPPTLKMRAPKRTQPRLLSSPALELEHFLLAQIAIRQRIADAQGLDLTGLRFSSPLARYIRMNLLEFFSVFNAHSRRHLRQANNVRRAMP
jgi:DinB superfamily